MTILIIVFAVVRIALLLLFIKGYDILDRNELWRYYLVGGCTLLCCIDLAIGLTMMGTLK
jgi:hypothetical protein